MESGTFLLFITLFLCFAGMFGFLLHIQTLLTRSRKDTEALHRALAESRQETAAMRRALTATHVQGQWGEIQLHRILDLTGMLPYCDFEKQVRVASANGSQRLDVLVRLPHERAIVVDAKSAIDSYIQVHEQTSGLMSDAAHVARLQQYAKRVRSLVLDLAKKEYWRNFEPTPEWVVLFIPNEGMFRAAVEHDPMQRRVLLASPVTLLALLKAIAHGWQQENRAHNVQLLVEHSHTLQQQLTAFSRQWRTLHGQLSGTVSAFNQFTKTYQTTLLPVIQQICDLDGTLNADEYDFSRTPPLQEPSPLKDIDLSDASQEGEPPVVSSSLSEGEQNGEVKL